MFSINPTNNIAKRIIEDKNKSDTLLILGSGWNHFIKSLTIVKKFSFQSVFGVGAGVPGHEGELILGKINQKMVWVMAGRFHTYEGYTSQEVTRPLQALVKLGVKQVIVTSASGGLNKNFKVGQIVILSDILALFCQSPLTGSAFQDLSKPFADKWRKKAIEICQRKKIPCQAKGVYAYVRGPHYESFADKTALQKLGADCVGMSSVPETIMANFLGVKVLGLSCITNLAFVKHSHQDVVAAAESVSKNMVWLLSALIGQDCPVHK